MFRTCARYAEFGVQIVRGKVNCDLTLFIGPKHYKKMQRTPVYVNKFINHN